MMLERVVRPFGASPLSFTRYGAIPPMRRTDSAEAQFDAIAAGNLWGSQESLSGQGSEIRQSAPYRAGLINLIRQRGFDSMFDAPCGDLNWMRLVLEEVEIDYIGGDISAAVIELNRKRYPHLRFTPFDITADPFPEVDVWHCRDCLFHLSYRDIGLALRNFLRSSIEHALITNHCGLIRNVDIETGGVRYLDLHAAPFALPKPQASIRDYRFGDLPRFVGLWHRDQIADALERGSL